jgi:hypothetical protein
MNINITLIIQAFNFCIVYWMVRYFLFKPVIGIIEHKETQENAIHDIITQQKKSIEIQEKERQRNWAMCREYFILHQPQLSHQKQSLSDEIDYDTPLLNPSPTEQIITIATQLSSALEEKIKHVH